MSAPRAAAAGWHGKLPCRGDFVCGGAQGALIEGWRAWAIKGLEGVRAGGDAARDAFLVSPFRRFAARAGVFGPVGGFGVIGPGADAGGRLFPVIVAVEAPIADCAAALAAAASWLDAVEAAALAALDPLASPAALNDALAAPPAPAAAAARGPDALFARGCGEPAPVAAAAPADMALFRVLFGPEAQRLEACADETGSAS